MSLCCCLNRQDLILQHSHASHPVVLCAQPYLPCGFCQDHSLVVWLQAQSDHLSRRRGGEGSGFDMLLKKHMSKCALKSLFYLLVQYFQGAVYCGIFFRCAALLSLLWRDLFISSLDSYILFVLLADPINTHFSLIFKL